MKSKEKIRLLAKVNSLKFGSRSKEIIIDVVRKALDCQEHFNMPKMEWKESDTRPIGTPILICENCANDMYEAIGAKRGDNMSSWGYWRDR